MARKIVAIIGARLNSSRLAGKQLLPLAGKALISRIVDRLWSVTEIDQIVLATTADDFNRPLRDWAASYGVDCIAFDGDVNDLVGRVDMAVQETDASALLYVCGDCPLIEPSTIRRMVKAMEKTVDADVVHLRQPEKGQRYIHEGFDLYSRCFWDAIVAASTDEFSREHVGSAYHHFKRATPRAIAWVDEPDIFAEVEHRLSVDTPSDYRFMRRVHEDWFAAHSDTELVDLVSVIKRLQNDPALALLNQHVHQKRVGEHVPRFLIVTEAGKECGLGHLSRTLVIAAALQDFLAARVEMLIIGETVDRLELALIPHRWLDQAQISQEVREAHADAIIVDVKNLSDDVSSALQGNDEAAICIGIDPEMKRESLFDLIWVPSFYISDERRVRLKGKLHYGWDHFLLADAYAPSQGRTSNNTRSRKLLVLSGGSDPAGLNRVWPDLLSQALPADVGVDWVQGPFAESPNWAPKEHWHVLKSPNDLPALIGGYDAVLCVFGVSFFECLQAGVPVSVCDPLGAATPDEWAMLKTVLPDYVASSALEAVEKVTHLLAKNGALSSAARDVQEQLRDGPRRFAQLVSTILQRDKENA